MKKVLFISLIISLLCFVTSCEKEAIAPEEGYVTAGRSLWPQNPLPPQVTMLHPTTKETLINGCYYTEYTKVFGDTLQLKFSATGGKTWYGTPSKLTKYRIVSDNVILGEFPISGTTKFPITYIINIPSKSLWNTSLLQDTTFKKWHSVGISVWQDDGKISSQGTYYYKPII